VHVTVKVGAVFILYMMYVTQPSNRPVLVRVGPTEWRRMQCLAEALRPLASQCDLLAVLQRMFVAGVLVFCAYSGPPGFDSIGRAARLHGLGDGLHEARGPASPAVDYVNDGLHFHRFRELRAECSAAAASESATASLGVRPTAKRAKATPDDAREPASLSNCRSAASLYSTREASLRSNNAVPQDTPEELLSRHIGAAQLAVSGRCRGLDELESILEICIPMSADVAGAGYHATTEQTFRFPYFSPPVRMPAVWHELCPRRAVFHGTSTPAEGASDSGAGAIRAPDVFSGAPQLEARLDASLLAAEDAAADSLLLQMLGPDGAAAMRLVEATASQIPASVAYSSDKPAARKARGPRARGKALPPANASPMSVSSVVPLSMPAADVYATAQDALDALRAPAGASDGPAAAAPAFPLSRLETVEVGCNVAVIPEALQHSLEEWRVALGSAELTSFRDSASVGSSLSLDATVRAFLRRKLLGASAPELLPPELLDGPRLARE